MKRSNAARKPPVAPKGAAAKAKRARKGRADAPDAATAREPAEAPLVLVVDDYVDAREMCSEFLRFAGYRVVEAADGVEAIEKAIELSPSLILMDLSLPRLDGWEATRRLKKDVRTRDIPIVALTGHALTGHAEKAQDAGCDGFLTKPCLPDVMAAEVKRMLDARKSAPTKSRK